MRTNCSRCRAPLLRETVRGAEEREMCERCFAHVAHLRRGTSLSEYLDMFDRPVLVSDGEGNVVAANSAMAALAGRTARDLTGVRLGVMLACKRSRLPGGCGNTMHCRDCTIRRMVAEVSRTRLARWRVPAYLWTDQGRTEVCVTVRPGEDDVVEVLLEDAPPEEDAVVAAAQHRARRRAPG